MKYRPKILITNDDGIHAPGIRHLWNGLKNFGDVYIIAPAYEQSAVGLSITIRAPLLLQKVNWPEQASAWSVNGTPADCVKLALNVVMKTPPDIVVSGINRGTNAGRNILYSGTVGGAIEAIMHDIPGIAFSCRDYENPLYHVAEKHVESVVRHVLENPLPSGTLLNVNFPDTGSNINGFKMARQGKEYWVEDPDERIHPMEGHRYYWLGSKLSQFDEHDESDIAWLRKGYMTAVPVHVGELTDHAHLKKQKDIFENIFSV